MASRRKLKKQINASMDLLYCDCIFYKVFVVDADQDAANKVIEHIAKEHDELLKRVSVNEGKGVKNRVKVYFKKLNADLTKGIETIGKEIAALGE